ncbi:PREDICTED: uncharacterized protein LOC105588475 [Cercocebus atys]|uniref:uncharacterized protein LOC105588475 n=1 Tax=Cercocebus atys TaxID=9531 RepID=UPI0005F468A0|nr:PREDICTED: uncharacterized protein LOC105588475 [Cercocebus atys]
MNQSGAKNPGNRTEPLATGSPATYLLPGAFLPRSFFNTSSRICKTFGYGLCRRKETTSWRSRSEPGSAVGDSRDPRAWGKRACHLCCLEMLMSEDAPDRACGCLLK